MSARTLIVIALSLICGLSAAMGVAQLSRPPQAAKQLDTTSVVVAAVNIPRGVMTTKEHFTTRKWPKELVPVGVITNIDEAIDRAVLSPFVRDEPISNAKIAPKDAGRGMAPLIEKGMRAFTIHTPTLASGVAGFILPGNKVDVLLTVTRGVADDSTGGGSTATLLQNVEILAVDQRLDAPTTNKVDPKDLRSVTLLVSPDHAAKLSLAQSRGTLHLSLRNDQDQVAADTRPVTMNELRFLEEAPLVEVDAAAAEQTRSVPSESQHKQKTYRIRTLRGSTGGSVYVESRK